MNATATTKTKESRKKVVDDAIRQKAVAVTSENSLRVLDRVLHLNMYLGDLGHRIAMAMFVLNANGVLGARAGGNQRGTLKTTEYRVSMPIMNQPEVELPMDPVALASVSRVAAAPPSDDDAAQAYHRIDRWNGGPKGTPRSVYKQMTGPPLAPDGERSRTITNYEVRMNVTPMGVRLEGQWTGIYEKSPRGYNYFLRKHFEGKGIVKRDLSGATEYDRTQIRKQIIHWITQAIGV